MKKHGIDMAVGSFIKRKRVEEPEPSPFMSQFHLKPVETVMKMKKSRTVSGRKGKR